MDKKKVFIVDDEESIRELFEIAFTDAGFEVILAETAEAALDIFTKNEELLVVFTDLNLPGMNGLDLCKRMLRVRPDAYLYAVTGYASIFDPQMCEEAGFTDYFFKPVDLKSLITAANEAFSLIESQ